jgi:hypothetical protein
MFRKLLIRCSNSSLLECCLPPRRSGFDSWPRHVSLGTTTLGWRWPWSSLSIEYTIVRTVPVGWVSLLLLLWSAAPIGSWLMKLWPLDSCCRPAAVGCLLLQREPSSHRVVMGQALDRIPGQREATLLTNLACTSLEEDSKWTCAAKFRFAKSKMLRDFCKSASI